MSLVQINMPYYITTLDCLHCIAVLMIVMWVTKCPAILNFSGHLLV